MMVVIPVFQLLLFGYAIDTDVRHVPTVVLDYDRSSESRDIVASLEATGFYDVVGAVGSYEEIEDALRASEARVGLVIPAELSDDIRRRARKHPATRGRRVRPADRS